MVQLWHVSNSGFGTTENNDIYSLCVFGNKVYAGTHNAGISYWTKVFESTDGIHWTLNHTFDDKSKVSEDYIIGMAILNNKLYALRSYQSEINLYETSDGSSWSLIKTITSISSVNYNTPYYLMSDGSKLYVSCRSYYYVPPFWLLWLTKLGIICGYIEKSIESHPTLL